jgi:hypothetical protein
MGTIGLVLLRPWVSSSALEEKQNREGQKENLVFFF